MTDQLAVLAEGLRKNYRNKEALAGFDLRIPAGTVCGLLGPNGAGKTTEVRILSTLLTFDGGQASVGGYDVARQAAQVKERIGLVGQNAALDEVLSGRQNLVMFGRLFHLSSRQARRRAEALLEQFRLTEAAGRAVKTYSGGMRRRLDIAASMILSPAVLFLDEPTTGLDPRGRNEVWEAVRALVSGGTTVLLTTQLLDEADQLADQVVVINSGRRIADGTPNELKSMLGGDRIDVIVRDVGHMAAAATVIENVTGNSIHRDDDVRQISAPVHDRVSALVGVAHALDDIDIGIEDIALRRPTLDEVFLHLTNSEAGAR